MSDTDTLRHTYTYDDQGRRTEKRDANDTLLEDYHYNAQGRLQTLTQYNLHNPEDSHTTQYQYDATGRLTALQHPEYIEDSSFA